MSKKKQTEPIPNGFLSIKEFAAKRGISVQAVYQSLNSTLEPFTAMFNGQKYVNYAEYLKAQQSLNSSVKAVDLELTVEQKKSIIHNDDTIGHDFIEYLKAEIVKRDERIAALEAQLQALATAPSERERYLMEELTAARQTLDQAQDLVKNQQILLGQYQAITAPPERKSGNIFSRIFSKQKNDSKTDED